VARPEDFVAAHLPAPPARVLEIGCGPGDLARALAAAGYDVVAIDPEAPPGPLFRRVRLEEFDEPGPFAAAVAQVSLHHIEDLRAAVDRIADRLERKGVLVLDEFARDRFDATTARWYYEQRQEREPLGLDFEAWLSAWRDEHADIHPAPAIRREVERRFAERAFAWVPYLYRYHLDEAVEPLERRLIEAGSIQATGFRYVGERLDASPTLCPRETQTV
jgi:SAM-dependent methyltransferase